MLRKKYVLLLIAFVGATIFTSSFAQPRHLKAHVSKNLWNSVKELNADLMRYVDHHPQVKWLNDSVFAVQHDSITDFQVNIARLKRKSNLEHFALGVELKYPKQNGKVSVPVIVFHNGKEPFIPLNNVDEPEANRIYFDFENMVRLMHAYRNGY